MLLEQLSPAAQDYIKLIYELTEGDGKASTNALAEEMGVRPASVTGMIQKLDKIEPALIEYEKWQGVSLTKTGRLLALELIRHHRLLESFLYGYLGYDWNEVHEEAHRLEHVISEALEDRLAEMMGHPQTDPHGALIPDANLEWPDVARRHPLLECEAGMQVIIAEVADEDAAVLAEIAAYGLLPRTPLRIVATPTANETDWTLQIGSAETLLTIPPELIAQILVNLDSVGENA